ncbi:pyruvate dehydrogenase phosphatase regulatory subunit, mitochondrial-like [Schistocerca cancellata]|uniref:pyruvate dehydrogenase phosphatase regulatory subunit, mitochondrial-like n=1 Tax=Schistocerca cancellata TaxID=274614 RepID=UPI0021189739|nr:pyruvate dehydrogenase phosphatase regulatory subunit, mitochondrial-like [Schistocerca cancellata]
MLSLCGRAVLVKQWSCQNEFLHMLCKYVSTQGPQGDSSAYFSDGPRSQKLSWSTSTGNNSLLPKQAQVVICGAGTVANSVAYHLVQSGWHDILVLEQERIGSGTSSFGSGTLGLFKPMADRHLIMYSIKLYRQLEELGYDIGLKQCGSLNLAQTKDRMISLRRRMAYHQATGLHCEVVGSNELKKLHPYLRTEDLVGAIWVPEDAVAKPQAVCYVLAKLAREGGARYVEDCQVVQVLTENARVKAVATNNGTVLCEYFINCAGMWARELGQRCSPKVRVPAVPAEHFYATTASPQLLLDPWLPCVRDYDAHTYAREWEGGFMVGGFEKEAKPAFGGGGIPEEWRNRLPQDWAHFKPLWEKAVHRLPILNEMATPILTNSPDNFTPDGKWILGETPEVDNYFVAVGMNGNSLQGAGGIGKAVAEWIIEGEPTTELLPFSVQRFIDLHNNRQYLQERAREIVGRHYSILYPHQSEYKYARKLRCSPLYSELESRGAVFGTRMGYERPLYFDSTYKRGDPLPEMPRGSFYKPKFFDFMREEYLACREGVGIIDMSSFSKIEIKSSGTEVVDYLQKLCSNDVNIPVGGISHTGMQNERGGYENDCMLVRKTDNSYFMVSPTSQQTRIFEWMRRHLPANRSVGISDLTSMYTVINVVGPKAPDLMAELSNSDVNLHPFTYKQINVGYASDVMVMAFTHTGEPGYCLYVPSEYALHVYEQLMMIGHDYGARDVGCLTQRFMRIERFIPFWGEELTSLVTPFEAGSGFRVKLDKEYFIGKFALQRQKEQGVTKRLVLFVLEDIDPDKHVWPWGGEPLYRNNEFVGTVTSAGYGFTLDKLICLGYIRHPGLTNSDSRPIVTNDFIMTRNAKYEVDIAGQRVTAKPHMHVPFFTTVKRKTSDHHYRPTLIKEKSVQ